MNYVKHHACQVIRTSIVRQLPAPMTNYFKLLSHWKSTWNNKLLTALSRVRTKAAQNGFYYQGAMIYNSLAKDLCLQKNEKLFLKKITQFELLEYLTLFCLINHDFGFSLTCLNSVYVSKLEILILIIRSWNLIIPPILIFLS